MEYIKLGNSDLEVSRICLGCMGFGDSTKGGHSWALDEESSREIIKYALDKGINFFDTAIAYQSGTSEQYVGRALRDFAQREDYVIATKFLPRSDYSISVKEHIENCLNQSLKNLGMEYVDLYIYHMWDYHSPMEEIMQTLDGLVKSGKVRYLGISNCFAWQLQKINDYARDKGLTPFVSIQSHYNLISREDERELIACVKDNGMAMTPYSALAGGKLSKRPEETSKRNQEDSYMHFKYDKSADLDAQIISRVMELSDKYSVPMTEISLAWLLSKVESPVVGATKVHQIDGMVHAVNLKLSNEDLKYLEEPYIPHELAGVMTTNK
jgi:1-deoxyxylulose-5-phosphate synthase